MNEDIALPPLPVKYGPYSAEEMQDYARHAVIAYRFARAAPVLKKEKP